jgi:hypothetical protein
MNRHRSFRAPTITQKGGVRMQNQSPTVTDEAEVTQSEPTPVEAQASNEESTVETEGATEPQASEAGAAETAAEGETIA